MTRSSYSSPVEDVSDRRQFFAAYNSGGNDRRPNGVSASVALVVVAAGLALAIAAGIQLRLMLWEGCGDLRTADDAAQSFATGLDIVRQAKSHASEDPQSSGPAPWRDMLP